MKISVIIPCYNQGQYLTDAIESVILQKSLPHELIIVNDGSTDNSLEVAKNYPAEGSFPIKVINQVNKGLSSARNTAIMNATGDYIFPLDADDIMLENCLERVQEAISITNADIVAPSFKEFGISNAQVILHPQPNLKDFRMGNMIGYFSAIRKDALLEIGGYSPRMIYGYEDYHLWVNLLSRGKKLVTIPEPLMLYRTKEQSMIHDAVKHHQELMAQIYKDFPEF